MYEHKTMIGDDLISAEQLDQMGRDGWELMQIVPYVEGMLALKPGEIVVYFRRPNETMQ